jgi:hypothetical protein
MDSRDYWTIEAMSTFGGSFVKALAEAARRADSSNLARIKIAFPEYWSKYEEEGMKLEAHKDKDQEHLLDERP